jgi:hypothetical protein
MKRGSKYAIAVLVLGLGYTGKVGAASPDRYDVTWRSPSADASGSMPLGNGDVGLNAWIDPKGDLVFYISKTDSWGDNLTDRIGWYHHNTKSCSPAEHAKTQGVTGFRRPDPLLNRILGALVTAEGGRRLDNTLDERMLTQRLLPTAHEVLTFFDEYRVLRDRRPWPTGNVSRAGSRDVVGLHEPHARIGRPARRHRTAERTS